MLTRLIPRWTSALWEMVEGGLVWDLFSDAGGIAVLRIGFKADVDVGLFFRGDAGRWSPPTTVAEEPRGGRPPGGKRGPDDKVELGLEVGKVDLGSISGVPLA